MAGDQWPPPRQLPTQSTDPVMHHQWPRPENALQTKKHANANGKMRSVKFSEGICSSEIQGILRLSNKTKKSKKSKNLKSPVDLELRCSRVH